MTRSDDKQLAQTGIAVSVVIHAVMFFLFAWLLGLDQAARELWRKARAESEVPAVTLLFPDQILPTPKLKPKIEQRYIRTTQNEPEAAKPAKADFISDRNTKAASTEAPFPDSDKPMPTLKGSDAPTLELQSRKLKDGKLADDNNGKPTAPKPQPHSPIEPAALPEQVAKAQPTPMAKLLEEVDKSDAKLAIAKLPIEVRKPTDEFTPPKPTVEAPKKPSMITEPASPKRAMENFSPFTETARTKGSITTKGDPAVDAEATPMGKFMRSVTSAVEKKWHYYQQMNRGKLSHGYMKVRFYVNREGKPEDVQFVEKANNPLMEDFTLEAILKAEIPPIPRDLLPMLDNERFPVEYDILIHD